MEMETMFTEQKWNILRCLSEQRHSPIQLAEKLNTSIANISQQLRLLETANLVKKEKIPNRDRGKPRTLFSLSKNYAYLISAMDGFAGKRLLELTDYQKFILKVWLLDNPKLHNNLEKFYWNIEPHLINIESILINKNGDLEIVLVTDKVKELENKLNIVSKKLNFDKKKINLKLINKNDALRLIKQNKFPFSPLDDVLVLYDSNGLSLEISNQKNRGDIK
jgi:DNA-binding transcriptional regulator GbsR (MarR family)